MLKITSSWLGIGAVLVAFHGLSDSAMAVSTYKDAVLADGPRYYWTFDEPSGSALNYGLGTGGTLGAQASATRTASGTTNAGGNSLSLGTAGEFTGAANKAFNTGSGGSATSDGTYSSYALEFWVKTTATPNNWYLMETHSPTANQSVILLGYQSTNRYIPEFYSGAAGRTLTDGPAISSTNWNHVVVGFKESGATDITTFYLNGILSGTASDNVSNQLLFGAGTGFIVGGAVTGLSLPSALLDEVALYNLSSLDQTAYDAKLATIASHYSAALTIVPEPSAFSLCALSLLAFCRLRKGVCRG